MINSSAVESVYLSGGQCHRPLCTYPPGDVVAAFSATYERPAGFYQNENLQTKCVSRFIE